MLKTLSKVLLKEGYTTLPDSSKEKLGASWFQQVSARIPAGNSLLGDCRFLPVKKGRGGSEDGQT